MAMKSDDGVGRLVAEIGAMLPAECWVLRYEGADCSSLIGATFPNRSTWTAEMCCLPCRIRSALASQGEKSHDETRWGR